MFGALRKVISCLLPKEERFYDNFLEMLDNLKNAIAIVNAVRQDNVSVVEKEISEYENKSDMLEYTIQQKLKASITTPPQLNRESILNIASTIDNVMDSMKSVAKRFEAGQGEIIVILNEKYEEFWKMLDLLYEAAEMAYNIMLDFSKGKLDANDSRLKRMHDIENQIDTLHLKYIIEKLYTSEFTGKEMVIMQLIGRVEGAADELQRLAKILQGILVSG